MTLDAHTRLCACAYLHGCGGTQALNTSHTRVSWALKLAGEYVYIFCLDIPNVVTGRKAGGAFSRARQNTHLRTYTHPQPHTYCSVGGFVACYAYIDDGRTWII